MIERNKEGFSPPCQPFFLSNTIPPPLVSSDGRCFVHHTHHNPTRDSKRVTEGNGRCSSHCDT